MVIFIRYQFLKALRIEKSGKILKSSCLKISNPHSSKKEAVPILTRPPIIFGIRKYFCKFVTDTEKAVIA